MSAATTPNRDPQRVERYAERYFQRSGQHDWPTVRQAARSLKLRQSEIEQAVDDNENLDLTYWYVQGIDRVPIGDWFVEAINPPEVSQ